MSTPSARRRLPCFVGLTAVLVAAAPQSLSSAAGDPGPVPARSAATATPRALHAPELRPLRRADAATLARLPAFGVHVDGERLRLPLSAVPLLPGQELRIDVPEAPEPLLDYQAGSARSRGPTGWGWTAPTRPGAYALRVTAGGATVHLTALVLHPATAVTGDELLGYPIGSYARTPLDGNPAYLPPEGFVEVRSGDADLLVSPRLALGQFLCKQPGEPRFIALSTPLVVKLEAILDEVERTGWDPASLVVMSAFRTPAYNRAIGNTTTYSRHLWGDAADIYLDGDGDDVMDDLNNDGRYDRGDAHALAALVERVMTRDSTLHRGGLATYRANAVHGPFVHVDARGHRARW